MACKCPLRPLLTSLSDADNLFRGVVIRELKADEMSKTFVVSVTRIYTGCTFKSADRVVVTTPLSKCGISFAINKRYIFAAENVELDAATKKQMGRDTKISRVVSASSCDYTREWSAVSVQDRKLLREYNTTCPKACDFDIDCPSSSITCQNGKCVAT